MNFWKSVALLPFFFSPLALAAAENTSADITFAEYNFETGELCAEIEYLGLEGQEFEISISRNEDGLRVVEIVEKSEKAKNTSKKHKKKWERARDRQEAHRERIQKGKDAKEAQNQTATVCIPLTNSGQALHALVDGVLVEILGANEFGPAPIVMPANATQAVPQILPQLVIQMPNVDPAPTVFCGSSSSI